MTKQLKALAIALAAVVVLGVALFLVMKNFGEAEGSSSSSRPDTTVFFMLKHCMISARLRFPTRRAKR
jgi:hypothetical protein